ncbi:MAG: DUF4861 domain-containing protein [Candidatus Marinimicrobia bacterium]|nr:DUF4861 domain-containing protein [Candidatus Neomarinimicrobiota bacterium]
MIKKRVIGIIITGLFINTCSTVKTVQNTTDQIQAVITVRNPIPIDRMDEAFFLDNDQLPVTVDPISNTFHFIENGSEVPFQLVDKNKDGINDGFLLVTDFRGGEVKMITIDTTSKPEHLKIFKPRVQAELSVKQGGEFVGRVYQGGNFKNIQFLDVPPEHTDHSFYIRYEGPGWESEKIGYRFYLDWRNAIDIFGKQQPELILQTVGLDGFDSYHEMSDWGMDILKVSSSLGIGSVGTWYDGKVNMVSKVERTTCEIIENGTLRAAVRTQYFNWKVGDTVCDITSVLSITAGSRLTRHDLTTKPIMDNLCTGIVKHPSATIIVPDQIEGKWTYFATWGKQSLAEDNLGMAILYCKDELIRQTEDDNSEIIVLAPEQGILTYYFLAVWAGEQDGINSETKFIEYLDRVVTCINKPLELKSSNIRN